MQSSDQDPKSIFGEALALADEAQRASYLDRVCAGEPDLRHEVESLLQAHEQASDFLRLPIPALEFSLEEPGTVIGRDSLVYANVTWRGVLPPNMIAKNRAAQEIVARRPSVG